MSNSTRCAACKSLRRRCSEDCVLAPYFPAKDPQRFSSVHKIFGASNVAKNLEQLPVSTRSDAADCIFFEASARIQDPVYGCTRMISQLQQQIIQTQSEIERIEGEITVHKAQQHMFQHQLHEQPSWFSSIPNELEEHNQFQFDEQLQFAKF